QCTILYQRNADPARYATPDHVQIMNNNNSLPVPEVIEINNLIADSFRLEAPLNEAFVHSPNAFTEVIASHQQIVSRLEQSLETVGERFAAERIQLQSEQDAFIRQKQDEFLKSEQRVREGYESKVDA